jgi:hypothetical protein
MARFLAGINATTRSLKAPANTTTASPEILWARSHSTARRLHSLGSAASPCPRPSSRSMTGVQKPTSSPKVHPRPGQRPALAQRCRPGVPYSGRTRPRHPTSRPHPAFHSLHDRLRHFMWVDLPPSASPRFSRNTIRHDQRDGCPTRHGQGLRAIQNTPAKPPHHCAITELPRWTKASSSGLSKNTRASPHWAPHQP